MKNLQVKGLSILLVAVLLATGCTSVNASQSSTSTSAPANTAPAPTATTADNTSTAASTNTSTTAGGSLTFTLTPGKSTASYKVREQLAGLAFPSDAIGKTTAVSGSVTVKADGSIDSSSSKFVVDMSTLVSDKSMRDNFIKRSTLQTDQFPTATFVPTQASWLPNPMPSSWQIGFQLTGDMTIHSVTKSITWTVTGAISGDGATGTAITSFKFEDFGLSQPRVSVVFSVVDLITLEIDGALQHSSN